MRAFPLATFSIVSLTALSNGFVSPRAPSARGDKLDHLLKQTKTRVQQAQGGGGQPMSYADRLREARAAKQAAGSGNQIMPTTPATKAAHGPNEPSEEEPESPFSPKVFEELRTAITLLAARLQRERPMSRSEFERFETAVAIIVEDAIPRQELPMPAQASMPVTPASPFAAATTNASPLDSSSDEFESEGPAWNPAAKNFGVPKGTRNTYNIDGMGSMNPDEYQQALRERVTARAKSARESGSYGNIAFNDYLKFLSKNPKGKGELSKEQERTTGHEDSNYE